MTNEIIRHIYALVREKYAPFSMALKLETSSQDNNFGAILSILPRPDVDSLSIEGSGETIEDCLLDLLANIAAGKRIVGEEG